MLSIKKEPLETSRNFFIWLYLHHPTGDRKKWVHLAFSIAMFIATMIILTASLAFLVKFVMSDLEESLYALFQFCGFINTLYLILFAYICHRKITTLLDGMSAIYDAYKNDSAHRYLVEANNKSEWAWMLYIKISVVSFTSSTVMCPVSALIYWYFNGYFDAKYVIHSMKILLPWDQGTLIGYLAETVTVFYGSTSYCVINGTLMLLFISLGFHNEAFYQMFQHFLREWEESNENRNDAEMFRKVVQFHALVKDFFLLCTEFYSFQVVILLICNGLALACTFFQLDLKFSHLSIEVPFILIVTGLGVTNLYFYCFFGQSASDSFQKIPDCLYDFNWQMLPVHSQKHLILMIANAQRPIFYHAWGMAVLNLETFANVFRAVITYYLMFKTLTADV